MIESVLTVVSNQKIALDTYELVLFAEKYEDIRAGQFINLKIESRADLLLKRPFCLCNFDSQNKLLTVCYCVVGTGTKELSKLKSGDKVTADYPLGKGFELKGNHKNVILLGGGCGIFPLYGVHKNYPDRKYHTFLGFKSKENCCYVEEFSLFSKEVNLSTDDGTAGAKSNAVDALKRNLDRIKPDIILTCGPKPMLKALQSYLKNYPDIKAYVSVEQRMGCGVGACLVCTCKTKEKDNELHNRRVCKDGPVFELSELDFD